MIAVRRGNEAAAHPRLEIMLAHQAEHSRRWPRRSRYQGLQFRQRGVAHEKAGGACLGNRTGLAGGSQTGAAPNRREAEAFAVKFLPVIASPKASRLTSNRTSPLRLNECRIETV